LGDIWEAREVYDLVVCDVVGKSGLWRRGLEGRGSVFLAVFEFS
jgi:hypothetical protein